MRKTCARFVSINPILFFIYIKKEILRKKYWCFTCDGCCPAEQCWFCDECDECSKKNKNKTNNNNALRPGFKPIRSGIFENSRHFQWANNFFRGLAFRLSVSDRKAHRIPNYENINFWKRWSNRIGYEGSISMFNFLRFVTYLSYLSSCFLLEYYLILLEIELLKGTREVQRQDLQKDFMAVTKWRKCSGFVMYLNTLKTDYL